MMGLPVISGTLFALSDGSKTSLCWNAVPGKCKFGKGCKSKRNHPGKNKLCDIFAQLIVNTLQAAWAKVKKSTIEMLKGNC